MNTQSYVTISVDDGAPEDLRTAELLQKYKQKATFYIPVKNPQGSLLGHASIRQLGEHFEVGGHTLNHCALHRLPEAQAWDEIKQGKQELENILGGALYSFCYPLGKFNRKTAALVKRAGFIGARTCMFNLVDWPRDPYFLGVSTQGYSHSPMIQLRHALIEGNYTGAYNYVTRFNWLRDWELHFIRALDIVEAEGGIAHLYIHSWEIEQQNDWARLERVLKNIAARPKLLSTSNVDLFRRFASLA